MRRDGSLYAFLSRPLSFQLIGYTKIEPYSGSQVAYFSSNVRVSLCLRTSEHFTECLQGQSTFISVYEFEYQLRRMSWKLIFDSV